MENRLINVQGKKPITNALRSLLTPIVKLLVELGFSFRDFSEVAKLVYVDVASNNYGIKGRKTNTSRVAIMTGLTRREVARLRKVIHHDPLELLTAHTVASKVLGAWFTEKRYQNDLGDPRALPITGRDSLSALIDRFRGDIPCTALIKELERVKSIQVRGGLAKVLARHYMPSALDSPSIERFGSVLNDVGDTIAHNLLSTDPAASRFEGYACNDQISIHAYEAYQVFIDQKAVELLADVDEWLMEHEADRTHERGIRLGVGIYAIANGESNHHRI